METNTIPTTSTVVDGGSFRFNFNTGRLERCQIRPELPKGTIVHAYGAGMCHSIFATTGNGDEIVKLSRNDANAYFAQPFHTLDREARPISEKFGIGFYYDLDAEPATDSEIAAAIVRGRAFLEQQQAAEEAASREWREGLEAVRKQYAGVYEEIPQGGYADAAHVARNVRKDLASHFPRLRFSVRKESYDCLRVSWTDGPTEEEVSAVTRKHVQDCERDPWNDDLFDHKDTHFTAVFGGVSYLFYRRDFSPAVFDAKKAEIEALCPACAGDGFRRNDINEQPDFWKVYELDHRVTELCWVNSASVSKLLLNGTSLYTKPAAKKERKQAPTPAASEGVSIVDYSEKAVAVVGDTKPHADTFKRLGGRFNARLSCGAGWIFPKSKRGALEQALGL